MRLHGSGIQSTLIDTAFFCGGLCLAARSPGTSRRWVGRHNSLQHISGLSSRLIAYPQFGQIVVSAETCRGLVKQGHGQTAIMGEECSRSDIGRVGTCLPSSPEIARFHLHGLPMKIHDLVYVILRTV